MERDTHAVQTLRIQEANRLDQVPAPSLIFATWLFHLPFVLSIGLRAIINIPFCVLVSFLFKELHHAVEANNVRAAERALQEGKRTDMPVSLLVVCLKFC